ncbi:filamentous hemagglutinin N-terminal domain-containing protein [Trichocoleus sp. FACHB-591]|uniref:two-partner secretion domain-containing protein n=1 Tax=Trichocoleus sp. FACHB-591 TaxID=2692872 RepID=UPI001689E54A|nr:filamentous hemagglutinin N-terminal domain-containing protein [Trichocoleus sp. FACHB-591]MBD2097706.1 filamentous hemagglutinin N-terminal domain-containing protein [Trichocoleus sp. FACHB-591]
MLTKNWLIWKWLSGLTSSLALVGVMGGICGRTLAQVTADPSLDTTVTANGTTFTIQDGTTVGGTSLFHSFSIFNVPNGGTANFLNPLTITNIFARVTGGSLSDIQGRIQSQGSTNLFLMNPNGIVFGQNAHLNIGGSFVGTTANAILFPGGGEFSKTSLVAPQNSLLAVSPSALLFNQVSPASITNQSTSNQFRVPNGRSLVLVGGDVIVSGNVNSNTTTGLDAPGGRIELGGLAGSGSVGLTISGKTFSLSFPSGSLLSNVTLDDNARVNVRSVGGGDIIVNANTFTATNGGRLVAGVAQEGNENGGNITINANQVNISGDRLTTGPTSGLYNATLADITNNTGGNSGDITITTGSISVTNGGQIETSTFGRGNAGTVTITARDTVSIDGAGTALSRDGAGRPTPSSGIFSRVREDAVGNGGSVNITAGSLSVTNGGHLETSTSGKGNAGTITITARDAVSFDGISQTGVGSNKLSDKFSSGAFSRVDQNDDGTVGVGKAGSISITTGKLSVSNGAVLTTSSFGKEGAGSIVINASNTVSFIGESPEFRVAEKGPTFLSSGAYSRILKDGAGQGGNISISTAKSLFVKNGAVISTSSAGQGGNAGNIQLSAQNIVFDGIGNGKRPQDRQSSGVFSTLKDPASGQGGSIKITTGSLDLFNGAVAIASTRGQGTQGSIEVRATDSVTLSGASFGKDGNGQSSGLFTPTEVDAVGSGGTIFVETPIFRVKDGAIVSARTLNNSDGGSITITANTFEAINGGQVLTQTQSGGNAGNITLNISDSITLSGSDPTYADRQPLYINRSDNELIDQVFVPNQGPVSGLFASTSFDSEGNGGNVHLRTANLNITNGARISSESLGFGRAGDITIRANGNLIANNGSIVTASDRSTGGAINIFAKSVRLFGDSDITTNVLQGTGGGGNITITAPKSILAFNDSDILSFARDGQGGNINTPNTPAFFGQNYRPAPVGTNPRTLDGNNRVDVNASGKVSGIITIPDTTFIQNSLTQLPQNLIDPNTLIANSCIVRGREHGQNDTFLVTGSGGLPVRPGDPPPASFATREVRSLPEAQTNQSWKLGDPIVEPQGIYRLASGQLVMSRECAP